MTRWSFSESRRSNRSASLRMSSAAVDFRAIHATGYARLQQMSTDSFMCNTMSRLQLLATASIEGICLYLFELKHEAFALYLCLNMVDH